jgi:hypothetical protein
MSDATVKAKTKKDWAGWFGTLDRAGADKLAHAAIAEILSQQHGIPGWWSQTITVEYERARGLRARHQTANGFQVAISKTIPARLATVYAAAANAARRRRWFPRGAFAPSSQTKNKYLRGSWNETARLELGFLAKGEGKTQIAVGVTKLASKADVEAQRTIWKKAFAVLADTLGKEMS